MTEIDHDLTIEVSYFEDVLGSSLNERFLISAISSGFENVLLDGSSGLDTLDARNVYSSSSIMFFKDSLIEGVNGFSFGDFDAINFEQVYGNNERDNWFQLQNLEHEIVVHGGEGNDRFSASFGDRDARTVDEFYGYGGNDYFNVRPLDRAFGGAGDDIFDLYASSEDLAGSLVSGGSGTDTLELRFGWTVDLSNGFADSPFTGTQDRYSINDIENVEVFAWRGYESHVTGSSGKNIFSVNVDFNDGSAGVFFDGLGGGDTLTGSAGNDELLGGDGNDTIGGQSGNDVLDGGRGGDSLNGGAGNDVLVEFTGNDTLDGGGGIDTVDYSALGSAITVNLRLGGAQTISTAGGTDILSNIENVIGGRGGDALRGNDDDNVINGINGNDILVGFGGDDLLIGDTSNDVLSGLDDDDILIGGEGRDILNGGAGFDTFLFESLTDSPTGGISRDRIQSFEQDFDTIDLSALDANTTVAGDQAFIIRTDGRFTGSAGELRYIEAAATGKTIVQVDVDGDRMRDFEFEMLGLITLTDSDFIL